MEPHLRLSPKGKRFILGTISMLVVLIFSWSGVFLSGNNSEFLFVVLLAASLVLGAPSLLFIFFIVWAYLEQWRSWGWSGGALGLGTPLTELLRKSFQSLFLEVKTGAWDAKTGDYEG